MNIPRRLFLKHAGAAAALTTVHRAWADNYPSRPIKLLVSSAPGGVHDVIGRLWADRLHDALGTIVVENQGTAGGAILRAIRSPPDGYTLFLGSSGTHVLEPLIRAHIDYDPLNSFEAVSIFSKATTSVAVSSASPFHSLKELIGFARANPGKLSYAYAGVGAISNVAGEMFKGLAGGLVIEPVAYRGMGPAQFDVMSNQVPLFFPNVTGQVVGLHESGSIRILSVNSQTRLEMLPSIPTSIEEGVNDMIAETFFGIFAPKGLAIDVAQKINKATDDAFRDAVYREKLRKDGFQVLSGIAADSTKAFIIEETRRWAPIIKAAGITAD